MELRQGPPSPVDAIVVGGGEMGARIRAFDWSSTPLGPVERWPQSLRSALSICLGSRFPMVIWWGPELILLYNDGWRPILGATKHPRALGSPGREIWPEIWDVIGPMFEQVLTTGQATWADDGLLLVDRYAYTEEAYFTWSYSPIRDESGGVGGVFTAVTETTDRVLSERRGQTLRDLASRCLNAKTVEEAAQIAAATLAENPRDVPFALLYQVRAEERSALLLAAAGIEPGAPAGPPVVSLRPDMVDGWPLGHVFETGESVVVEELGRSFASVPTGAWPDPPGRALVLPIALPGHDHPLLLLVAALNPRRALDEAYRRFLELVSSQLSATLADVLAYEAERRRAEALEELDRAKTAFFSNVSHEFRTPLTLLLGPLEDALKSTESTLSDGAREQLEVAHRNALRLLRLVNTLLDFSRIEAGRVQASFELTDLPALTRDLASTFRSAIERAGLRLMVACPPMPEGIETYVDREMWEKVVLNLLSNAFKFTLQGDIAVSLDVVDGGQTVRLRVQDTGIGIPAEELPHLFERFHRVAGAQARTHEGTGIGLALVHELVKLHGGRISATSEPGEGTTFSVDLPTGAAHLPPERVVVSRGQAPSSPLAEAYVEEAARWLLNELEIYPLLQAAPSLPSTGGMHPVGRDGDDRPWSAAPASARVLLADDNADMREYVARLLSERYEVIAVADGMAALSAARAEPQPDLVLSDVMMPRLDGFELMRALRDDPLTKEIPVILLSARAGEEARVEGIEAGADDYLVKPFAARELLARVGTHLELARMRAETTRREQEARAQAQRALQLRDEFLAVAAHELKTPLTTLRLAAQLMQRQARSELSDQARLGSLVERIDAQSEKLARLVDQLLDISRLQRGRLVLQLAETDLVPLVRSVLDAARAVAPHAQLELRSPAQLFAEVDALRLEQVMTNLVDNAIKYSPNGGRIEVELATESDDRVSFTVRDQGIGVASEHQERIFEPFFRVLNANQPSGMGLGLHISRQIVELHGGELWVETPEGGGTRFVFTVPTRERGSP